MMKLLLSCTVWFCNCLAKSLIGKRAIHSIKLTIKQRFLVQWTFSVGSISSFSSTIISAFSFVIWYSNSSSQNTCWMKVASFSSSAIIVPEARPSGIVCGQTLSIRVRFLPVVQMYHQCPELNSADFVLKSTPF